MPSKRINRVELEKFRGATTATQIDFDSAKPIVVIFGENGSGKSTIGNALDFVCNSSKGSLDSLSSTRYSDIVSIGNSTNDLRVRIHVDGAVWEGSQNGATISVNPKDGIPKLSTLRRSKLLKLVEATPKERFDTIRSFIDFEKIETSEQKLRDASRRADKNVEDYSRLYTQAKETLDTAWATEGSPGGSAAEWARARSSIDTTQAKATANDSDGAIRSIEKFESELRTARNLRCDLRIAETELTQVEAEIAASQSDRGGSEVTLVEMLSRVRAVVADPYDRNECPACLSTVDLKSLRDELEERIASLQNAERLSRERRSKSAAVDAMMALAKRSSEELTVSIRGLRGIIGPEIRDSAELIELGESFDAFDFDQESLSYQQEDELLATAVRAKPLLTAKRDMINRDLTMIATIKRDLDLVDKTLSELEAEDVIARRLKHALEIVHNKRIKETQSILDAVFHDFLRYWEAVHPGEPLKPTKLELSETAKGSLNQVGSFCGHDGISPQAYFSESHLDTLGFCYWLAIAKYSTKGDATLVLDDVFTSVDNEHLTRVLDLLVAESSEFNQIVLFTHQRRWYDAFRFGAKSQGKVHVMELGTWDLATGITAYPTRMEVKKLIDLLKSGPLDRQAVCGKAGVLLEQVFDELTKQYKCSMPRGPRDEYTLDAYAGATTGLFKKLKVIRPNGSGGTEEIDLLPYHTDLRPFVAVRNQVGAHFNLTAAEFVDKEIVRFGNLTVDLISILLCRNCLGLANRMDKGTGKWNCECKQTQMLPNSI